MLNKKKVTIKIPKQGCAEHTTIYLSTNWIFPYYIAGIYGKSNLKYIVLDEADSLFDDSFNQLTLRLIKKLKVN